MPETLRSAKRESLPPGPGGGSAGHRIVEAFPGIIGLLGVFASFVALAHPGLDEQIAELTARIRREPANAELLLRRSEVHRWHGEFAPAFADIDAAARLQPGLARVDLARALTLDAAGEEQKALAAVQAFLISEPAHAGGLLLRARCYSKLGPLTNAMADYSAAIRAFAEPSPDLFVERARLLASLGRLEEAVQSLDEGLTRLGPVPALQRRAIDYERQQGRFDAALRRVDKLASDAPAKEPWLVLRAELLEQAGKLVEAKEAYRRLIEPNPDAAVGRMGEPTLRIHRQAREGLARVEWKLLRLSAKAASRGDSPTANTP